MIAQLTGRVAAVGGTWLVVDLSGFGLKALCTPATAGASQQASTNEETINYEISSTSQTEMTDPGAIKRLSVAVVVDGIYTTDASGNSTYAPRDQATLDQIKSLVQSAIGFDQTRGDQITVANLQFASGPTPAATGTPRAL